MNEFIERLSASHEASFQGAASTRIFTCPGRINLIGEHVDYNGGHVLPAAVDRAVYLCVSENNIGRFRFNDTGFDVSGELPLSLFDGGLSVPKVWLYPAGALSALRSDWDRGFDLSYLSTIPVGAGMSSSAAITTVTLYAMAAMTGLRLDSIPLGRMAQRVEQEYAGVACGIMDQFAVIFGRKGRAMLLDTRDLSFEYLDIGQFGAGFVLVNSGVRHSLRESAYNDRRRECESALDKLCTMGAKISYLCDLSPADYERLESGLPEPERKRGRHAVSENARTLEFARLVRRGDLDGAGALLYASHKSLRDDFEVSTEELDGLVEWASGMEGVYGSRMMGGGFGGCSINMVEEPYVNEFVREMAERFKKAYGSPPEVLRCAIGDGVREVVA